MSINICPVFEKLLLLQFGDFGFQNYCLDFLLLGGKHVDLFKSFFSNMSCAICPLILSWFYLWHALQQGWVRILLQAMAGLFLISLCLLLENPAR